MPVSSGAVRPVEGEGRDTAVRGSVVEARFPDGLPSINEAVIVEEGARAVFLDVAHHADPRTMRNPSSARSAARPSARACRSGWLAFWQGLGLIGSIGWMVVIPSLIGAFLGRWIDARGSTGIFWTLSLLSAGLALDCLGAWRHMEQEARR